MKDKCGAVDRPPHELDELLEHIFAQGETGKQSLNEILKRLDLPDAEKWVKRLETDQLITRSGDSVSLTPRGKKEAEQIIRRHRLTERLFADVFQTPEEVWEREACELEHSTVLVDEAMEAVCAFLGHPTTCPHNRPIPPGDCCSTFQKEIKPLVIPLTEASVSKQYQIVFITPKEQNRIDRLAILGVLPGSRLKMYQKRPSHVIRVGETDIALDKDIARDIYVKQVF
ncbi:MAG: metal-dependent transcriptional regulator [bacterium]|nr:metal-dependent transcriptional regulator [bacterium]